MKEAGKPDDPLEYINLDREYKEELAPSEKVEEETEGISKDNTNLYRLGAAGSAISGVVLAGSGEISWGLISGGLTLGFMTLELHERNISKNSETDFKDDYRSFLSDENRDVHNDEEWEEFMEDYR